MREDEIQKDNIPRPLNKKIFAAWMVFAAIVAGIVIFTLCDQVSPAHAEEIASLQPDSITILAQDPPTERTVTMQFKGGGRFVWEGKKMIQKTLLSQLPFFWREFAQKVGAGKICAVLYECEGETCVRFTDAAVQDLYNICYYGE